MNREHGKPGRGLPQKNISTRREMHKEGSRRTAYYARRLPRLSLISIVYCGHTAEGEEVGIPCRRGVVPAHKRIEPVPLERLAFGPPFVVASEQQRMPDDAESHEGQCDRGAFDALAPPDGRKYGRRFLVGASLGCKKVQQLELGMADDVVQHVETDDESDYGGGGAGRRLAGRRLVERLLVERPAAELAAAGPAGSDRQTLGQDQEQNQ